MGCVCLKEIKDKNYSEWRTLTHESEVCNSFEDYTTFGIVEWDENKNSTNKEKHKISFDRAIEIINDPRNPRIISPGEKEKIDIQKFLELGVDLNEGNLDPYRDLILGEIDKIVYVAVTTFRGPFGKMKLRIISLRPASDEEEEMYYSFRPDKR